MFATNTPVISYTRFSSGKQRLGLSEERQVRLAEEWCQQEGLKLDSSLTDRAISGWSGKNAKKGALAELLKLIQKKQIPKGTILIIEALDRLTRQELTIAITLLIDIVTAGIEVVTLIDRQRYTKESLKRPQELMLSIMLLGRGWEESERKSGMVRSAYEAHRQKGSKQIFGSAPGWLTRKDKFSPWELVPERAEAVRKVFELTAAGYGSSEIAKKANAEGWPIPTRLGNQRAKGWTTGMAGKIARSRSAIGEHEHRERTHEANEEHWEGKSRGLVIANYYPAVVSEDLFYRAQAAIDKRRRPQRRDRWYLNIWSGLLECETCGGGLWRKTDENTKTQGQVRCRNAGAGICEEPSMPIKALDGALLFEIAAVAGKDLTGRTDYTALAEAEAAKIKTLDEAAERIADAIASGAELPALTNKAKSLAAERKHAEEQIEAYKRAGAEQSASLLDTTFANELIPHLYTRDDESKELRAEANAKLRRLIEKISIKAKDYAIVRYTNGTEQTIALSEEAEGLRNLIYSEEAARRLGLES